MESKNSFRPNKLNMSGHIPVECQSFILIPYFKSIIFSLSSPRICLSLITFTMGIFGNLFCSAWNFPAPALAPEAAPTPKGLFMRTHTDGRGLESLMYLDRYHTRANPRNLTELKKELKEEMTMDILKHLEDGAFGSVSIGQDSITKAKYAIKILSTKFNDADYCQQLFVPRSQREIFFLSNLRHENIVRFYGQYWHREGEEETTVAVVLKCELLAIQLQEIIEIRALSLPQLTKLIVQIGSALEYMHAQNTVHHDVKPSNIMLNTYSKRSHDASLEAATFKLIDFGLTREYKKSRSEFPFEYNYANGTHPFMCFEKSSGRPYEPYLADVYAFGMTLFLSLLGFEKATELCKQYERRSRTALSDILDFYCFQEMKLINESQFRTLNAMLKVQKDRIHIDKVLEEFQEEKKETA